MIKYCKQLNKTDCGPIAVINALKWAGLKVSIGKNYKDIRQSCYWVPRDGTDAIDMRGCLDRFDGVATNQIWRYTLKSLDQSLDNGKALILLYTLFARGQDRGHFIFIHGRDKGGYFVYNDFKKDKSHVTYITRKEMKKRLSARVRDGLNWDPKIIEIIKK